MSPYIQGRTILETKYLFVDGAYLKKCLERFSKDFFDGVMPSINYSSLFSGYRKVFYYDCLPPKRPEYTTEDYEVAVDQMEGFFCQLRSLPGVHVYEGFIKGERRPRQKGVDVAIAVDMLTHSYKKNMDKATLLAGDLDFLPLVEALVKDGMYVNLWYCDFSVAKDLVFAADEGCLFTIDTYLYHLDRSSPHYIEKPEENNKTIDDMAITLKNGHFPYGLCKLKQLGSRYLFTWNERNGSESCLEHSDPSFLEKYATFRFKSLCWND